MSTTMNACTLKERLDAVICPLCTERRADGSCGLECIDECPIATHLDSLLYTAVTVESPRLDDYVGAVREDICATCRHRTLSADRCEIRAEGHCALDTFLGPVLEVMDDFVADVERSCARRIVRS
jgi:hypothetical protein